MIQYKLVVRSGRLVYILTHHRVTRHENLFTINSKFIFSQSHRAHSDKNYRNYYLAGGN
jgi:hypothetical protein